MPENQNFVTEEQLNQMMEEGGLAPAEEMPAPLAGKSAPAMPTMPQGSTAPFFSGSLPPQFQLDSSFSRARAISSRVPHNDLMPLGTQSNPSVNAGTNSTARVLAKTPGFTNMDLVNNGQTRVALAAASSAGGSTGGSVAFNFRGVWLSVVPYFKGDEVIYQTSYWMATAASTNSAPATGNANWQVVGSYAAFRGPWSSSTAYVAGDEVTYLGNFWVATTANTNSAPSTSNSNWVIAGPNNLDAVQDGNTFGRTPTSNYGQQTPIGKITGLEVSSNADFEFNLTGYNVYDNNSSGSITITQVSDTASPNGNGTKMKIVEAKVGAGPTPGLGGFFYSTALDNGTITADTYHVGDTYILDLVAMIPVGYTLNFANNSLGTGGTFQWLNASLAGLSTPPVGTGNWQHYIGKVVVGTSPSSANAFPFFYLTGADGVTWYVSSLNILDMDQLQRAGGGKRHVGPGPGGGTKFGHGIGVNGGARSVGVVMHGGFNRKFLTTDPFYGIYGSPSVSHEVFVNGAAQNYRATGSSDIRFGLNDTQVGGKNYSWSSGFGAAGQLNSLQEGVAGRTYLNTTPAWGFYGSPAAQLEVFTNSGMNITGTPSYLHANDTAPSAVDLYFRNNLSAAGLGGIQRGGSYRYFLNNTGHGFEGTPTNWALEVHAANNIGNFVGNNNVSWMCQDTQASGRGIQFGEGIGVAGTHYVYDFTGGAARIIHPGGTTTWGFYGTPGTGVPIHEFAGNPTVRLEGGGVSSFQCNDTDVNGRNFAYESGRTAAGIGNITDLTAGTVRTQLNSTPEWGFFGSPGFDVHVFGQNTLAQAAGVTQLVCRDTRASGNDFNFQSGNSAAGQGNIAQAGSVRTTLSTTPQWGFFGSPSYPVHTILTNGSIRLDNINTGSAVAAIDTNASGRQFAFKSGNSAGNQYITDETAAAFRTNLNSTPQWGFYGSPAGGDVSISTNTVEQSMYLNGAQPGFTANDTGASGNKWGFNSGVNVAGLFEITQPGTARRMTMDGSGNTDLITGNTPTTGGFITSGGGKIATNVGNLVLKNINNAVGTTNQPTTTSSAFATVPEMTITITTKGNQVFISFACSMNAPGSPEWGNFALFRDAVQITNTFRVQMTSINEFDVVTLTFVDNPSAASHTYTAQWSVRTTGDTLTAFGTARQIQVVELG